MTNPKKGEVYEAIGKMFPEWVGCVAVATGDPSPSGLYPKLAIIVGAPKGWIHNFVGANMKDWKLLGSPDDKA